jgi:hypothetical protein
VLPPSFHVNPAKTFDAVMVELPQLFTIASVGAEGCAFTVIDKVLALLAPQALLAVTETAPDVEPKVTITLVVPCPDVILAPEGTLHVYEVAPLTEVMK